MENSFNVDSQQFGAQLLLIKISLLLLSLLRGKTLNHG